METNDMQLTVLKRIDPLIYRILFVSTFSSIFENDEATSQWHPLDREGSLYVVEKHQSQTGETSFIMILLNRKTKEDFIEKITEKQEYKRNQEFIQYKTQPSNSPEDIHTPPRVISFTTSEEGDEFLKVVQQAQSDIAK